MQLIYTHAVFALLAVPLGLFIFITQKGTKQHRMLGRIWVTILVIVSLTAIFIQAINPGQFSLIHLLIPWTLGSLIYSIWNIKSIVCIIICIKNLGNNCVASTNVCMG